MINFIQTADTALLLFAFALGISVLTIHFEHESHRSVQSKTNLMTGVFAVLMLLIFWVIPYTPVNSAFVLTSFRGDGLLTIIPFLFTALVTGIVYEVFKYIFSGRLSHLFSNNRH